MAKGHDSRSTGRVPGMFRQSTILCGVMFGALLSSITWWLAQPGPCSPSAGSCAAWAGQHLQQQAALAPQPCDYGLLAGYWSWSMTYGPGTRWQTVYEPCQLQNRLLPPAGATTSILLLGDSVDLYLAQEYAGALNVTLQPIVDDSSKRNRNVLYTAHVPADAAGGRGQLQLGMRHLLGVHPTGPYHANETGSYKVRIPAALAEFKSKFKRDPDMVLLSSNMWDQARMWAGRDNLHGIANKLLPEAVHSWAVNFTQVLQMAAATFPQGTLLAYHTTARPSPAADWLGNPQYVDQLNDAGVQVARQIGWAVVDLAGMVDGLPYQKYLSDLHHPRKDILMEMMNVAMNLLHQHRQQQQRRRVQGGVIAHTRHRSSSRAAGQKRGPTPGGADSSDASLSFEAVHHHQVAVAAATTAAALQLPAGLSDQELWQYMAQEQEQQELELVSAQLEWCASHKTAQELQYQAIQHRLQQRGNASSKAQQQQRGEQHGGVEKQQQQQQQQLPPWAQREEARRQEALKEILRLQKQQAAQLATLQQQQAQVLSQFEAAHWAHQKVLAARRKYAWGAGDKVWLANIHKWEAERLAKRKRQQRTQRHQQRQRRGQPRQQAQQQQQRQDLPERQP